MLNTWLSTMLRGLIQILALWILIWKTLDFEFGISVAEDDSFLPCFVTAYHRVLKNVSKGKYMFLYKRSVFESEGWICLFFQKSSLKIYLRYDFLRTFKRANFMIWPMSEKREFIEGIKMLQWKMCLLWFQKADNF